MIYFIGIQAPLRRLATSMNALQFVLNGLTKSAFYRLCASRWHQPVISDPLAFAAAAKGLPHSWF